MEQLALRWHQRGIPISGLLRPGLSEPEIDDIAGSIGITLPREARMWWGWHDGALPSAPGLAPAMLGPGRTHLPLSEAVRWCSEIREIMRGIDGQLPAHWKHGWLPMTRGHLTVFDCGGALDGPVPVRYYRFEEPDTGAAGVPSIGTLVALYIEAYDSGAWSYDPDLQTWQRDSAKLDGASRREHLV